MHRTEKAAMLAAAMLFAAVPAYAADPSPELIKQAAATKGGEIVVQSTLFEAQNKAIADGFNARFGKDGLKIRVQFYNTSQQIQLYEQELRAGKVNTDILLFTEASQFLRLARENKFVPYCSANFTDYRDLALTKDCQYFFATSYYQYIAYNTDQVKPEEMPTSWLDLTNPKWKGKVSIPDPKVGGGHYYFVFTMYKLFGKEFFEKAKANDVLLTQSHGVTENQVMSGERAVGVSISQLTRLDGPYAGGKGAPIKEAFPKEGGALIPAGVGITLNGPNLAGAKVFIDWLSSLEGQKVVNRSGLFSLRKDFTSVEGDDLSKIKYHWFDPVEMDQVRDAYTKESQAILTGK